MTTETLRQQFAEQRAAGKRHKDAAAALGISEGQAIAAHISTGTDTHQPAAALQVTPLQGPWLKLLQGLEACGPVMALTRNNSTVHEKTGVYQNVSGAGHVALAVGEAIDLRLFLQRWHAGFAVSEGASLSLQFFDAHGVAVHKIFARDATDRPALQALIAAHTAAPEEPAASPVFSPAAAPKAPRPDADIDTEGLGNTWAALKDTHDFFGMLGQFDVERQQSFRLMQGRFTQRLKTEAVRSLLLNAAVDGTPIMVFVGNPGCIQIHTGPVVRVEPMDMHGAQWLNVLDPGFNLHLREDHVATVWLVEKPTSDGTVTSVEAFDHNGEAMAVFFGARKPGKPELEAWRALAHQLPKP